MGKIERKSPIKNLPVRMPGQSSREKIDALLDDDILFYLFAAACAVVVAMMEWIHYLNRTPPMPWVMTIIAVITALVCVRKLQKTLPLIRRLKQGAFGEEAVGQFLEEKLRPMGCHVLHDVLGDGFNVDHVVVGPTGVFCVETKTHSKPLRGDSRVKYDGTTVTVDGMVPDRDPIVQARAEAKWVGDVLEASTGRRFFVQPVVVYPGWFVEPMPPNAAVWVLNENAVPTFIKNANGRLSSEDVALITFHLKRYVIAKGSEAK